MIELAVATRAETFRRMRDPLADRGIHARYVNPSGRTFRIGGAGPGSADEFDGFDVGYVYPPRPMEGDVLDARLAVPWVNGRAAIMTSRNKGGVLARLAEAGVPVPETVVVSNPVDRGQLEDAYERFDPPVVVKPNSGTRGVGVAKAHDLDSLVGIADYLDLVHGFEATGDKSFLLQEYLPDARDYRVMVIDGHYVGAVERRLPPAATGTDRWKHNVHQNADAKSVEAPPEHRHLAERVASELDIDLLGVDLLVADGRVVVSETNARPTIDEEAKYEPGFYDRLAALIRARARAREA